MIAPLVMLCSLLASPEQASTQVATQAVGQPRDQIALTLGLQHGTQRDELASPVVYAGLGPLAGVGYERRTERDLLSVELGVTRISATSEITVGSRPRESQIAGRLRVGYQKRMPGSRAGAFEWFAGGALFGDLLGERHRYGGPVPATATHGLAIASLAPTVRAELALGGGRSLSANLGVPVLGLVWRTALDAGLGLGAGSPRVVSPGRLAQADGTVRLSQPLRARATVALEYRIMALSYHDAQRYRRLSHAVAARMSFALGSATR